MLTRSRSFVALLVFSAVGCAGERTGHLINPPPAGPEVVRLFGPEFDVPPSSEIFMCYTVPIENTEPIFVAATHAWQVDGGHHVLVLSVDDTETTVDAPHECTPEDMAYPSLRFVGAGTAAGSGIELPIGAAVRMAPGRRLLIQGHYLNSSTSPIRVQDAIDLTTVPEADVVNVAGAYTAVDQTLELPPRSVTTRMMDCSPPMNMTVPWMFAHMHEWGTHATIELVRDGVTTTVYDAAWDSRFRDDFPVVVFPAPMELTPADRIITRCTWENTEDHAILFPTEMCATFMPYYPSDGTLWVCDETGENYTL